MRHYQEQLKQEEGEARARWENSGMSVADYIRSRAEEGEPAFDLDWEMMRQLEHDQAQGMFQVNKEARDSRSFGSDTAASAEALDLIRRSVTAVRDSLTTVGSIPNLPKKVNTAIEGIRKSIESIATGEKIKGLTRPVNAKNLITSLSIAGFHRSSVGSSSAYLMLKDRSIRISDHSADAWRFKRDNNLSIKLSRPKANKPFNASANNNVIEATYGRRFLEEHPDVLARMLRDVAEFAATGEFHDTAGASKVEFSGEQEYKNNAIKILIEDARKRNDTQAEQALIQQLPENLRMDAQAQGTGKGVGRFQIENKKPWNPNFPKVMVNTTLGTIKHKLPASFKLAKAGNREAAIKVIKAVAKVDKIKALAKAHPNAKLVAVHAEEMSGRNQLPMVYSEFIAAHTNLEIDDAIVQSVRAHHTGVDGFERFARRAEFDGEVEKGREYILVDDHVTQGGTLSELRHYIENKGGKVVAVTTLTASQGSTILPIQKATLAKLIAKYGKETTAKGKAVSSDATGDRGSSQRQERDASVVSGILSDAPDLTELLRRGNIAGSIEALTESEAQYILKFKPEAFRRKIDEVEARLRMDAQAQGTGKGVGRFQIERLYTGSAADYAERVPVLDKDGNVTGYRIDNKPSLLKIGTGEGGQAYGYGLYASSERGVAEYYSLGQESSLRIDGKSHYDSKEFQRGGKLSGVLNRLQNVVEWNVEKGLSAKEAVKEALNDSMWTKEERELLKPLEGRITHSKGNIYEQTWFTNRAPGDESHLLKWYEPVSEEQKKWIAATAKKEGFSGKLSEALPLTGEKAYGQLEYLLGSPKAASEFLARADIDGIKYPVDSYGGKPVKDGDKAGWNYVSFRDDNIRVDHKWVDGVAKFGIAPSALGNGKQKYYEVPFEKAVDKIVKAGAPIGRDQVFVSETPEVFAKIGLTKLPIMMTQKHVLTICNDANTLSALGIKGNAHDMERVLKQIPRAIKNPLMIIASTTKAENSIVAITALKDKTGKTVIAPIVLNGTSQTGNTWIDSHVLSSAYGKDNTWSKLVVDALQDEANGKVAVFYIDTTRANLIKNQLARVDKSGVGGAGRARLQLPRRQHRADLVHSIADPGSPVKGAIVARNWAGEVYRVCVIGITDVKLYENENAAGSLLAHKLRGHLREFTDDILSHYIRKGKGVNLETLETCSNHLDCEIRKYYTTNPESDISKVNCQVWKRNNSQRKSRIV